MGAYGMFNHVYLPSCSFSVTDFLFFTIASQVGCLAGQLAGQFQYFGVRPSCSPASLVSVHSQSGQPLFCQLCHATMLTT